MEPTRSPRPARTDRGVLSRHLTNPWYKLILILLKAYPLPMNCRKRPHMRRYPTPPWLVSFPKQVRKLFPTPAPLKKLPPLPKTVLQCRPCRTIVPPTTCVPKLCLRRPVGPVKTQTFKVLCATISTAIPLWQLGQQLRYSEHRALPPTPCPCKAIAPYPSTTTTPQPAAHTPEPHLRP